MFSKLKEWNENQLEKSQKRLDKLNAQKQERKIKYGNGSPLAVYVDEHKSQIISSFGSLYLFQDRIIKLPYTGWSVPLTHPMRLITPEEQPIKGVSATIEFVGGTFSRGTLTRSVLAPGWQKKINMQDAYIVIDGPEFQWQIRVGDVSIANAARQFVSKVNTAGRQYR